MEWFMIQSRVAKMQFVPLPLVQPIFDSMVQRGALDQSVHTTEYVRYQSPWADKVPVPHRSGMQIPFDGVTILLYAEDVSRLLWDLKAAPLRVDGGWQYYKVHGISTTLCLTPEQRDGLITTLSYKMDEANQMAARDYHGYNHEHHDLPRGDAHD